MNSAKILVRTNLLTSYFYIFLYFFVLLGFIAVGSLLAYFKEDSANYTEYLKTFSVTEVNDLYNGLIAGAIFGILFLFIVWFWYWLENPIPSFGTIGNSVIIFVVLFILIGIPVIVGHTAGKNEGLIATAICFGVVGFFLLCGILYQQPSLLSWSSLKILVGAGLAFGIPAGIGAYLYYESAGPYVVPSKRIVEETDATEVKDAVSQMILHAQHVTKIKHPIMITILLIIAAMFVIIPYNACYFSYVESIMKYARPEYKMFPRDSMSTYRFMFKTIYTIAIIGLFFCLVNLSINVQYTSSYENIKNMLTMRVSKIYTDEIKGGSASDYNIQTPLLPGLNLTSGTQKNIVLSGQTLDSGYIPNGVYTASFNDANITTLKKVYITKLSIFHGGEEMCRQKIEAFSNEEEEPPDSSGSVDESVEEPAAQVVAEESKVLPEESKVPDSKCLPFNYFYYKDLSGKELNPYIMVQSKDKDGNVILVKQDLNKNILDYTNFLRESNPSKNLITILWLLYVYIFLFNFYCMFTRGCYMF